ncbi:MAG: Hsp33 family molecular chaperone HslO [Lentisphaeria bacterium]
MINTDFLLRGSFKQLPIRFVFVETTQTVTNGIKIHNTDPVASHIWASALTVSAMLSSQLTENERYTIRWNYNGLIDYILTDICSNGQLRGIPKATSLMQANDVEELYGEDGTISIVKFSQSGKILSSGTAKAAMLDINDDISYFFATSDQIETEISSSILFNNDPEKPVKIAAGFMIQALPDCDLDFFEKIRNVVKSHDFVTLLTSELNSEKKLFNLLSLLLGKSYSDIEGVKEEIAYEYDNSPNYHCSCSLDKVRKALVTLPKAQISEMLENGQAIHICCDFCKKNYEITEL